MAPCLRNSCCLTVLLLLGLTTVLADGLAGTYPIPNREFLMKRNLGSADEPSNVNPTPVAVAATAGASPVNTSGDATLSTATSTTTPQPRIIVTVRPLLGQNGTGQRWTTLGAMTTKPTVVSEPIGPGVLSVTAKPALTTAKAGESSSEAGKASSAMNPVSIVTTTQSPKATTSPTADPPSSSNWSDYLDNVDTDKSELTEEELKAKNLTLGHEVHHQYYNSTTLQDAEIVQEYLKSFQNLTPNSMLSKSHRRAMTVRLKFLFPFYGHMVENLTVATGGFIYTGDYVHSWLAATQFIAPLMANFDTSLSNDSFVKYYDNGTAFTVLWENVQLQDVAKKGGFTFSATLHKNGDIVFGYYNIPMSIASIEDKKHPVKVGLSDAFISDKTVYYTRRKTIFEYHRVSFESDPIKTNTMITLKPEPTCNVMETCDDCTRLTTTTSFKCGWCPTINRCSTGTDRKRHDWLQRGCDKSQITREAECPSPDIHFEDSLHIANRASLAGAAPGSAAASRHEEGDLMALGHEQEKGNVGTVMGLLIPFGLIVLAVGWVFYAYRNPHTKSGQFLIQYRPSQWSWRRGEARYTAATIHM